MRRRWRLLGTLLLLGLLGYGVWWWQAPKRMHVVKHVTFEYPPAVTVCARGYLFKDVFFDWRGKERWRLGQRPPAAFPVEPPIGRYRRTTAGDTATAKRQLLDHTGHATSISPSSEYLARATIDGHKTRLQVFRHGTLIADRRLPLDFAPYYTLEWMSWIGLQVHDDGTIWAGVWGSAKNTPVYVVKDNRITATGMLPRGTFGLSPDARFYVPYNGNAQYYSITLKRNRVVLSPGVSHPSPPHVLLYDGAFISGNGTLYRGAGKATGERVTSLGNSLRYLVDDTPSGIRIFHPTTGDAWQCTIDGKMQQGYATDDGRHVVLLVKNAPGRVGRLIKRYSPTLYQRHLAERSERYTYIVYKRPGKVVARHHLKKGSRDCSPTPYLSPDGRAMLLTHYYTFSHLDPPSYYTLLRW
ncbi:MAG: hypothetical protein ACYDCO_10590 [Armatimonadota bacterium]